MDDPSKHTIEVLEDVWGSEQDKGRSVTNWSLGNKETPDTMGSATSPWLIPVSLKKCSAQQIPGIR